MCKWMMLKHGKMATKTKTTKIRATFYQSSDNTHRQKKSSNNTDFAWTNHKFQMSKKWQDVVCMHQLTVEIAASYVIHNNVYIPVNESLFNIIYVA